MCIFVIISFVIWNLIEVVSSDLLRNVLNKSMPYYMLPTRIAVQALRAQAFWYHARVDTSNASNFDQVQIAMLLKNNRYRRIGRLCILIIM